MNPLLADNPCILPVATGNGNAALPRWYFDTNVRRCTRFTYTGMGGNQDNFLSLSDCQLRCPEFQTPCATGDPAQSPLGGILFCSSQATTCPATYWCHVGADSENTVCCPGAADPCSLPQAIGTGAGIGPMNRWYFDTTSRLCKLFSYSGLGGNQNNFQTQTECQQKCPAARRIKSKTLASFATVIGTCQPIARRPFGVTWVLLSSRPSAVLGVSLQVLLDVICVRPQAVLITKPIKLSVLDFSEGDPCTLPLAVGSGPASMPRWYFSTQSRQCLQFTYTGLAGNQNNFLSQRDCQQACPGLEKVTS
ncbi:unnamed protein product [Sphagnum jensenii]